MHLVIPGVLVGLVLLVHLAPQVLKLEQMAGVVTDLKGKLCLTHPVLAPGTGSESQPELSGGPVPVLLQQQQQMLEHLKLMQ